MAVVAPLGGYWTMIVRGAGLREVVECPALPTGGSVGWWHKALGLDTLDLVAGYGIRVGIADTGLVPHSDLAHAIAVGAFIDGEVLPANKAGDVDAHGTHVAGIIGGRPTDPGNYAGVAPRM